MLSEVRLKKLKAITEKCYVKANEEFLKGKTLNMEQLYRRQPERDNLYRIELCKLNTSTLEAILTAHESGQQRRMPITLDAIRNELANRVILDIKK